MTLKMTSAQVVETSVNVNNNSFFQNYTNPDDHTQQTTDIPGFKFITIYSVKLKRKKKNKKKIRRIRRNQGIYKQECICKIYVILFKDLLKHEGLNIMHQGIQGSN